MFKEIPADRSSIANRKLIHGKGVNDADYQIQPKIDGKRYRCKYYEVWRSMIIRCYDPKSLSIKPTYVDCTVCDEWLTFSNFRAWMESQNWKGMELDKDILKPGSKIYSPDTCVFVPQRINKLLNSHAARKGKYYQGVSYFKPAGKYVASCSNNTGKAKHLGYFKTELQAHKAYLVCKAQVIRGSVKEFADELHPDVISSLKLRANQNQYLAYLI